MLSRLPRLRPVERRRRALHDALGRGLAILGGIRVQARNNQISRKNDYFF